MMRQYKIDKSKLRNFGTDYTYNVYRKYNYGDWFFHVICVETGEVFSMKNLDIFTAKAEGK